MALPLNLTFGVEIELVVCYDFQRYASSIKSNPGVFGEPGRQEISLFPNREAAQLNRLVRADIIECLQRKGVPVHGLVDEAKGPDTISCWTISYDVSIRPPDKLWTRPDGARYTGVEIKTPALYFSESALMQIQEVIDTLKQNFTVSTTGSCGLHVHVGNRSFGFPLTTVKNLGLFVTVFERQFNSLHPIKRIKDHQWCRPPTRIWGKRTVPEKIASDIEVYDDLHQLVDRLCWIRDGPDRYHAYNFINLNPPGSNTIEFRQHEGTIDVATIIHWASLCCTLVRRSHAVGELGWFDFLADHFCIEDSSVVDLIRELGDADLADYCQNHRTIHTHHVAEWQWQKPGNSVLTAVA
ncbi:MAG: hypothetical protein LQ352_005031 [Teloschistes flavicans]|nr:MAG: hypothetical protein LQ352_005031 [Teloschistes flavicans]